MRASTLADHRKQGIHSAYIECNCGHSVLVNLDHLPATLEFARVRLLYRCSKCGDRPYRAFPNWSEWNCKRPGYPA